MKISVNDNELFTLSEVQKKVIAHNINADELDADLQRRLRWVINHKYEQCMKRLREEWLPELKKRGCESVPLDDDAFANLVFSQEDYMDRKQLDNKLKA